MNTVSTTHSRPFGLRFATAAINTVQTAQQWRALTIEHGDANFADLPFDSDAFACAITELRDLFAEQDLARAADQLNTLLRTSNTSLELHQLPDSRWALRPPIDTHSAATTLRNLTVHALAAWAAECGRCAWGICTADGCSNTFVDEGRREPQRFCSANCATRTRVAAHRLRKRDKEAGGLVVPSQ